MTITDIELNSKYELGINRLILEHDRIKLPELVDNIKLNPNYMMIDSSWSSTWDKITKSRLIESLIINIPVIPIILYEKEYKSYEVIDGKERLKTIVDFYSDRLTIFSGIIDLKDNFDLDVSLSEKNQLIVEQVSKLLLNTMLVLNYKPELLDEQPSESKGVGFGNAGKLPSTISRNPVWIGKVYSGEREYSRQSGRLIRPSREHYRRGHWARRRHGTREKWQYQWHWIEPTIVNG